MGIRYLLDTNIVSDLIRNPQGRVFDRIMAEGEESVCIDLIIAGEIRFGLARRNSAGLTRQASRVLAAIELLPLEPPTEQHYADIRLTLESAGCMIRPNDLWIAAHARARSLTLVTDNLREFSRVPGLKVENWLT
jgi:tRNA(fMet)-specific endonuclease VapC